MVVIPLLSITVTILYGMGYLTSSLNQIFSTQLTDQQVTISVMLVEGVGIPFFIYALEKLDREKVRAKLRFDGVMPLPAGQLLNHNLVVKNDALVGAVECECKISLDYTRDDMPTHSEQFLEAEIDKINFKSLKDAILRWHKEPDYPFRTNINGHDAESVNFFGVRRSDGVMPLYFFIPIGAKVAKPHAYVRLNPRNYKGIITVSNMNGKKISTPFTILYDEKAKDVKVKLGDSTKT